LAAEILVALKAAIVANITLGLANACFVDVVAVGRVGLAPLLNTRGTARDENLARIFASSPCEGTVPIRVTIDSVVVTVLA